MLKLVHSLRDAVDTPTPDAEAPVTVDLDEIARPVHRRLAPALAGFLGSEAGLSPLTISQLTEAWQGVHGVVRDLPGGVGYTGPEAGAAH